MHTRPLVVTLATCFALASNAAQAGDETRQIAAGIERIELSGPFELEVTQGETRGVRISGSDKQRARVRLEVNDRSLVVAWDAKWNEVGVSADNVRVSLSVPMLGSLSVKGSGDARVGAFAQPERPLAIAVGGSGDVRAEQVQVAALEVSIAGSGDVRVGGEAAKQSVSIAGSGDYSAPTLASRNASVSIAGSGDAEIAVSDKLEVSIAGSGEVRYHGQPRVARSIVGSGDVRPARER